MKPRKTVCKECPFKRDSCAGYLGEMSYKPEEFLNPHWHGEEPLHCHMMVDWEAEDRKAALERADLCRGLLIFAKNSCKTFKNRELEKCRQDIDKNTVDIFHWYPEFLNHHKEDI